MASRTRVICSAALLGAGAANACSSQDHVTVDPYLGDAYPDLRTSIAWPAHGGLITNSLSDTLSVVDLDTPKEVFERPVGRDPVDIDGPHHIAVDSAERYAYVALAYPASTLLTGPHAAHGSSTRAGYVQKLDMTNLAPVGEVRVQENPGDIVLTDDGANVLVSHFDLKRAQDVSGGIDAQRATLAIIPTATLTPDAPTPTFVKVCVAPHGIATLGNNVYLACYGEDAVAIVDLTTHAVTRIPMLGAGPAGSPQVGPYALMLSPDKKTLVVSNTESKDLRFLDVASSTFTSTVIGLSGGAYFPAFSADGATLYIPTQSADEIVIVDVATHSVSSRRTFTGSECVKPHEVRLGEGGVQIVCEGDHVGPGKILITDFSLKTTNEIPVGVYPDRLIPLTRP